ncbi:hypothetical protein ACIA5H_37590 [Nocardia sp. NPDC051900]|uniref:hypothetical protein n=1 Tax=Nocardia sp. NPDC051900 TaxID=3364326 RepID=UPI0037A82C14
MKTLAHLAVTLAAAAALATATAAAASADTISYYTNNSGAPTQVPPNYQNETDVRCNDGDTATGGGALLADGYYVDEPYMRVVQSGPVGVVETGPAPAWRVTYHNEDREDPHGFVVYVICAHVTVS